MGYRAEVTLKYFLVQAWGSIGLIWRLILIQPLGGEVFQGLLTLALFLKLGVVPFHFWFLGIIKILDWNLFVILSTLQKTLPIYIVSLFGHAEGLKAGILLCRIRVFMVARLKFFKFVIAVSSVFRLAWLLTGALGSSALWIVYLSIYTGGLIRLVKGVRTTGEGLSLLRVKSISVMNKFIVFFRFIVLAGLPPFIGFLGKMLLFSYILELNEWVLAGVLLFGAIWIMYIYVRIRFILITASGHRNAVVTRGQTAFYSARALVFISRLPSALLIWLCIGVGHIKFWILRTRRNSWYISTRVNSMLPIVKLILIEPVKPKMRWFFLRPGFVDL